MKFQVLLVTGVLLVLLSLVPAPSKALGGQASSLERQPGAGSYGEDPQSPRDGGDNLPGQSLAGKHPLASAWELMRRAPRSSRSSSKMMAKPLQGRGKQDTLRKLLPQPSRSRSPQLNHHLKGHGKFNGDTRSCSSIQSRSCQKPSDCGGCLGLYTCKLPTGTCALKAVSRQRDLFMPAYTSCLVDQEPGGSRNWWV